MKYFVDDEFVCKCCNQLPTDGMNPILLENLDKLREMYGKPILISSAYRCPKHNAEIGGVRFSQHTKGNAADIFVMGDYKDILNCVIDSELFDGVGTYWNDEFVHVDVRNNGESPNMYQWEG